MQEEVRVNEALLEQQFVNKTRVHALQARRRRVPDQAGRERRRAVARQAQRRRPRAARSASLRDAYVQEATTELRDVNSKLIDLEEQLRSARDASSAS